MSYTDEQLQQTVNNMRKDRPSESKPASLGIALKFDFSKLATEAQPENVRRRRLIRRDELRDALAAIIPPLYADARLVRLAKPFKARLFEREQSQGLLLWGPAGVGKTYAAMALARHFITQGKTVLRESYGMYRLALLDAISNGKAEAAIIRPMQSAAYLILDDVGTARSAGKTETDHSLERFLGILDYRLEHCKPTFLTSNKSPEALRDSFDERVYSRLRTYKIIHVNGEDKRGR